jgi:large subunit ribosomal protein L13
MKTVFAKKGDFERKWYVVDAQGEILGRMANRIAVYLRGKHKPVFTPNIDTGDFVIVVNADKVKVTGNKLIAKKYYRHSGYIGGINERCLKDRLEKEPEKVIMDAVYGMLPKTRLGKAMLKKLKVYRGGTHGHEAQKPELIKITKTRSN